ncbi:ATP-binding protein [Streptomyces armeniacus]|uniref:ATP-binding protein n=1 Tax=Streptomyces armeniacus TaxID=83291 RepID=A0A345XZH5_9ACTN|nr:ATP-binding protein [Streptomyces armeniacus]AXK37041.1 ATP-binding protein [Streptomyces armeniacus]
MRARPHGVRRTARVEYALPRQDVSASWARRLTAGFLAGSRTPPEAALRTDEATLIVSELVTNATQHGRARCRLRLSTAAGSVTIEVYDDGPGRPAVRSASADSEGGRGIALVRHLSRRLDVTAHATGGKTVRAVLAPV